MGQAHGRDKSGPYPELVQYGQSRGRVYAARVPRPIYRVRVPRPIYRARAPRPIHTRLWQT